MGTGGEKYYYYYKKKTTFSSFPQHHSKGGSVEPLEPPPGYGPDAISTTGYIIHSTQGKVFTSEYCRGYIILGLQYSL